MMLKFLLPLFISIQAFATPVAPNFPDGLSVTGAFTLNSQTASRACYLDASKNIISSATTATELGYVSGVTSAIQTQLNGKQASGNYITALTGDGSASGPGSATLTLATVNSSVGSYGSASVVPTFTVNGKGLITAATPAPIQITESQVTSLVSDLAGKQASGNYITALTGDVTASGPGSVASTLATVNTDVGTYGSASTVPTFTVNGKGLITAATPAPIQIAESQVTSLVSDLAAKQTAFTYSTIAIATNLAANNFYFVDTSGGGFTVTLPAPSNGAMIGILDSTGSFDTSSLTVAPHGSEKIQGLAANFVITEYRFARYFLSNGTDWFLL